MENTFCIFKSINNILYLIYNSKNNSTISYDLLNNKKINEIKHKMEKYYISFRHYLDQINKRDLLMNTYAESIEIFDVKNWNRLVNIQDLENGIKVYSSGFLSYNNKLYIISTWSEQNNYIKIFDLNGNKINIIKNTKCAYSYYIDSFYDNRVDKIYILTNNEENYNYKYDRIYTQSYDYKENKICHQYGYKNLIKRRIHVNLMNNTIIINKKDNIIHLIETCFYNNIRIWNFDTTELLESIEMEGEYINNICLWDRDYLLAG